MKDKQRVLAYNLADEISEDELARISGTGSETKSHTHQTITTGTHALNPDTDTDHVYD